MQMITLAERLHISVKTMTTHRATLFGERSGSVGKTAIASLPRRAVPSLIGITTKDGWKDGLLQGYGLWVNYQFASVMSATQNPENAHVDPRKEF